MALNDTRLIEVTGRARRYHPAPSNAVDRLSNSRTLFGVEIELENFRDNGGRIDYCNEYGWQEHQEGSLVNGREFVMHPPRNGEQALAAIDWFFDSGFRYTMSERTSIHIHVDMSDDVTIGQLRSILALTYMLEGPIYRMADENRKWGSYSCPLTDMNPPRFLGLFAGNKAELTKAFSGNYHEEKYYGCNTVSLRKHGTLEYRYFPCVADKAKLLLYVNLCIELKRAGEVFANPIDLFEAVNTEDKLIAFMRKYMPMSCESLFPYLDVPDSLERITAIHAICTDANVMKAPRVGGELSPAIMRFVNAKKKKPAPEQDEKEMHLPLADLYDVLREQQRRAREGERLIRVAELGGLNKPRAVPKMVIHPDGLEPIGIWLDEAQGLLANDADADAPDF